MSQPARYHHGALREALLGAAERILVQDGLAALTLRRIAREAGVSHGAPAHHFEDLSALLSELAAVGFRRLAAVLRAALPQRGGPVRFPVARAYVAFALDHPDLFSLMFREEKLTPARPSLREARQEAFDALAATLGAPGGGEKPGLAALGAMTAAWSLTHGFAALAADGRLAPLLRVAPPGSDVFTLMEAALEHLDVPGRPAR